MKLWAFASGSSGNCFLVESDGTRLLVECGRPKSDVLRYLANAGVEPASLSGILLTHAHSDHIRSARNMSDAFRIPVFASVGTLGHRTLRDSPHARPIAADAPFTRLGALDVHPFAVPHDCVEPLGYRFEAARGKAAITTDLGWVPDPVAEQFKDLDVLVLEANYDPEMLHTGRYPAYLKRRVAGYHGHLANGAAADALVRCGERAPRTVWLAHMSEHNNTPRQALDTIGATLRKRGLGHIPLYATRHRRPSLRWDGDAAFEQLPLW